VGIPVKVNIDSGGKANGIPVDDKKVFAFPPEWCSPSKRNAVRNHTGMVFGFRLESRSPSTGFPSCGRLRKKECDLPSVLEAKCRHRAPCPT